MREEWSNLAKVVFKRTYARPVGERTEKWPETVERVIFGNVRNFIGTDLLWPNEIERLKYYIGNRKAMPAGRGLWYSGTESQRRLGGVGLCNCWFLTAHEFENFVLAQDLLMLGGGVGLSVEHKFVSKLPKIKTGVVIKHECTKDAEFIVPDSREGWCELTRRVLTSYLKTGKGFTYSTICVRGEGEPIRGFGGTASGPLHLITFVEKLCKLFDSRAGKSVRPIDAADIICAIGEMVVAGNVRRSAIIILGDSWDKEYLKAKRWDLSTIPSQRGMANFSVIADDYDDLHPLFWETYIQGEPFGIVNRTAIQKFGRIGELKPDTAIGVNPCAEATLEDGEPCNLAEIFLPNLQDEEELIEAAVLMHRWCKRVTCENYHNEKNDKIVKKNRRVGVGITGCLQSKLFNPESLDKAYKAMEEENVRYSKQLGIPESVRLTVVKPSGTLSKLGDCTAGIHAGYSRYMIQRVRFGVSDPLVPLLKEAGHKVEPVIRLDGTLDHGTMVAEFYIHVPEGTPVADEEWDTWKQLEVLKMAQKYWADQSVSVTVYYSPEDVPQIKEWVKENLAEVKTISFLKHQGHGFKQAPWEPCTKEEYEKATKKIRPLDLDVLGDGFDVVLDGCEATGACPIK